MDHPGGAPSAVPTASHPAPSWAPATRAPLLSHALLRDASLRTQTQGEPGTHFRCAACSRIFQDNYKFEKIWLPSSVKPGLRIKARTLTLSSTQVN